MFYLLQINPGSLVLFHVVPVFLPEIGFYVILLLI